MIKTTFKADAKKLPEGLQVETNSRGFKIIMDEPEELGGTNASMNPIEAILCALGACQVITATALAPSQNFKFEECHIELEGDMDQNVRNGLQEIRFVMHFKTNEPKEKVESFVKFVESKCPVGDCLSNGVKLVLSDVVID